jgi:hypothetical protein
VIPRPSVAANIPQRGQRPLGVFHRLEALDRRDGQGAVDGCQGRFTVLPQARPSVASFSVSFMGRCPPCVAPTTFLCQVVAKRGKGRFAGARVDATLVIENYSPN